MIRINPNSNWLKESVEKNTELTAISSINKTYSYSTLSEKVNCATSYLVNEEIGKNTNVAILLDNNMDFVTALFAVWNCGATVVPLNTNLTTEELIANVKFTDCEAIVTSRHYSEKLNSDVKTKLILIDEIDCNEYVEIETASYKSESPAIIMFTSGSSGVKKAAVLTFGNLYASSKNIDSNFNFESGEKWLASLPFYHIGGLQVIIRSILSGGELLILDDIKTENILECISANSPHYISIVNSILQRMLEQKIIPTESTKVVFAGGGPINSDLLKDAVKQGMPVYKVYGSTETASMVTLLPPRSIKEKMNSAGKPIGDVEIKIIDENKEEVQAETQGEIAIKGGSVISSYYNNAELDKEKFLDGFFLTGDSGYVDKDGYLFVLGRKDNFIITGGEKVDPGEVKQALMKLGYFTEVHIIGIEDSKWGQKVCAVYIPRDNIDFTNEQVKEKLASKLPSYKIPKRLLKISEIPKTGLGKIDTLKLKTLLSELDG